VGLLLAVVAGSAVPSACRQQFEVQLAVIGSDLWTAELSSIQMLEIKACMCGMLYAAGQLGTNHRQWQAMQLCCCCAAATSTHVQITGMLAK
jgi:hypothetical protein